MPSTTSYSFGDVVLVPFPFTDQTATKKRPAVVVSSRTYLQKRRDLIIMAITSQLKGRLTVGEFDVSDWKGAGLLKPSMAKPVLATIERKLVIKRMGRLKAPDLASLQAALGAILGETT